MLMHLSLVSRDARAVALLAVATLLLTACRPLPRSYDERVNTVTPTPGAAMLRSLSGETECRPLTVPAELPDVAALVDTILLRQVFPDSAERAFGLTFNRLGDVEEVRLLHANALAVEVRREVVDRFYPAIRRQQPGDEWSVRVTRDAGEEAWRVERSIFCPARLVRSGVDARGDRWRDRLRNEVHVTVGADGLPTGVFMPIINSREEDDRNRRIVSRYRFLAATLNGEPVQSVVVFGHDWRVPNPRRRRQ